MIDMIDVRILIIAVLIVTMAMFLWGRWRHDFVAMGALLLCVFLGLVPGKDAFLGFGHPAVITVACVLVLGYGLLLSGAVDILAQRVLPTSAGPTVSILVLIGLAALLSGFMNNVGALALLMPVALQMASRNNIPPGKVLMPLSFGSILGGMTTMIGTPPNLIVAGFRTTTGQSSFGMFDFTPVGLSVAFVGVVFVGLVGWRLVPKRKQAAAGSFESGTYLSEVRIVEGSKAVNKRLREVEQMLDEADAQIIAMIRNDVRITAPNSRRVLREGDILVIEVEPESMASALSCLGLKLEEDVRADKENKKEEDESEEGKNSRKNSKEDKPDEENNNEEKTKTEEAAVRELVVMPNSVLINRSATDIELRTRYGINLLAISRQGLRSVKRLRSTALKAGDVLMMQGPLEALSGFAAEFECLPLAKRDIRVPKKGHTLAAALIMTVAVCSAALGIFPVVISFVLGVVAFIAVGIIPLRSVYTSIDWSVIVLLAAMLPIANAIASTSAADMIARFLLDNLAQGHVIAGLVVIMVVTMFLSDLMNNAATAAVMCPIAISGAHQLGVNPDAYLMAVAVGASCAFLTPIGHQNNTLILGPGGFRFGDYWRLGIVLEIIVIAVSVPMILWVWPL